MVRVMRGIWVALIAAVLLAGCSSNGNVHEEAAVPSMPSAAATAPAAAPAVAPESPVASPSPSDEPEVEAPAPSPAPSAAVAEPPKAAVSTAAPSPSAETPVAEPAEASAETKPVFTISIIGIGEWGTIVDAEPYELKDGDTVVSVLKRVAKAHRLAYDIRGSGALSYIEGIDGLYEFDYGPTSGWKFRVNGEVSDIGAGIYTLKPGDHLEWYYVEEDELAGEASQP